MRFADFFSGIGGFRLGLERTGHECVYSCEIDDFCREVQHERFGREPEGRDINEVRASDIPDADLWCGGFPCQGNSTAGQRKGLADPRSGLIGRFLDLVGEKKPTWLFLENVPGLLSVNKGEDWQTIFRRMAELGYVGAWRILDAQYLGVPQRRRRVFVVARRLAAAGPDPSEILFEPEGVLGSVAKSVAARSRAADGTQGGTGGGRRGKRAGGDVAGTLQSHHPRNAPDDALCVVGPTGGVPFVAGTLGGGPGRGWRNDLDGCGAFIPAATTRESGGRPNSNAPGRRREDDENLVIAFDPAQVTHPANGSRCKPGAPAPTLAAKGRPHVAFVAETSEGASVEPRGVEVVDPVFCIKSPTAVAVDAAARHGGVGFLQDKAFTRISTPGKEHGFGPVSFVLKTDTG